MTLTTTQLLGTLEVLSQYGGYQTCFWETETQGEFSLWNLMISEGNARLTDLELAFEHWQNIEHWGTPTDQNAFYEYAPPRSERKDDTWNEAIATERQAYYQQLQQLLTTHLQNLQAYNLSIPNSSRHSFEWDHPNFSVSIVVGETRDRHWLCLAPTVPDQVSLHGRNPGQSAAKAASVCEATSDTTQTLVSQIRLILDKLNPISIYGYYYGGYNYTYLHQIVYAIDKPKATAIELALQAAEIMFLEKPKVEYANDAYNSSKISEFMNQCLRDRTRYSISFWDIGYTYELGKTPAGDWIGVQSRGEFEYNP